MSVKEREWNETVTDIQKKISATTTSNENSLNDLKLEVNKTKQESIETKKSFNKKMSSMMEQIQKETSNGDSLKQKMDEFEKKIIPFDYTNSITLLFTTFMDSVSNRQTELEKLSWIIWCSDTP